MSRQREPSGTQAPSSRTVAVGPAGSDDAALATAWARVLAAGGSSLRLTLVPASSPIDSLARLTKGEAQEGTWYGQDLIRDGEGSVADGNTLK